MSDGGPGDFDAFLQIAENQKQELALKDKTLELEKEKALAARQQDERQFMYQKETDILFIHLSPWVYCYGDEIADGVFVMRSDSDDHAIGFEILDYSLKNQGQIQDFLAREGFETEALPAS